MEQIGAVKEGTGILRDLWGALRGWRHRPRLELSALIGTELFREQDAEGRVFRQKPAEFLWINVYNRALSAHSDAKAVLGHLWIDDEDARELFHLRARWRKTPLPSQVPPGTITDRLAIGPGLSEQLDAVWKYPEEATAFALNTEAIAAAPKTWQDTRYALGPGHYWVRVKVEGINGGATEARFKLTNPGVGSLSVHPTSGGSSVASMKLDQSPVTTGLSPPTDRPRLDPASLFSPAAVERARLLRQGAEAPQKRSERESIQHDARQVGRTYRAMAAMHGIEVTPPETRLEWLDRVMALQRRRDDYVAHWSVVIPDSGSFAPMSVAVQPDWLEAMARDADAIVWQLDHEG